MIGHGHFVIRDIGPEGREAFVAKGHLARHFFPHRIVRLPKGGPDGLKLARRMCRSDIAPSQLLELVLYARSPALEEFPPQVFFDDDIVWHQQQFGLPGHVATASVIDDGADLYVPTLVSDLVQRIGRRRDLKTRIEKRFKGWAHLLMNAVLDLALERGAQRVFVACPELAHANTDRNRVVQRPLFDRIYEGTLRVPFRPVRRGAWSMLDVGAHAETVVRPQATRIPLPQEPQICVCHDIERGWGHLHDPALAGRMDADAPAHLERMLAIEAAAGVRATYCILGFLVPALAETIRAAGHAVAFHSFDHAEVGDPSAEMQLGQCREVDYRIKGYRPARSRLTPELTDANLSFHNFEWLGSSQYSLGTDRANLANGVVRLPILFDDIELHRGADYGQWRAGAVAALAHHDTAVFSLHDCYAATWLAGYQDLLSHVAELGRLRTLDEVAADVLLARSL